MKKNFLMFVIFFVSFINISIYSQLSGSYNIPGNFATVEAAIDSLNQVGVGGNVTFNVAAGHTETFSKISAGLITATGYPDSQITFQKFGSGANPLITAAQGGVSNSRDGIIVIAGGDYITFDGMDVQENPLNTTKQNMMEWGYALVKASKDPPINGCRYVTIKNCNITLNKSNGSASGIYANNHTADTTLTLTLGDSLDIMSYCKFYSNTISNVNNGIRLVGSTNAAFLDQYNEVGVDGGNNISNYSNGSSSAYGMNLEYQNNLKVANNIVNGGGAAQTGALYGIRTGSATNANLDVYNNTVTLVQGGTSLIYAIVNSTGSSGTNNKINIYDNIVENCSYATSSSNSVWLIYNLASCYDLNIYGNIIRNNSKSAGTGTMHCIYNNPTTANTNVQIYDNQIYNNSSAGTIHGIHATLGTNIKIFNNNVYDLRTTSTSTYLSAGITIASGPINSYIYNNFISDLKALSSSTDNSVRGINITSTTANSYIGVYYNTIFLNAPSGGGTTGIYHTNSTNPTTATLDMRNNIVVNNSTTSGKTVAFRRSAANVNLNNYSTLSNNNSFFAGTPGVNNLIFYDGTNSDQTLADFKARVSPRETNSVSENAAFVNSTTAPYDLHINTAIPTQLESGGTPINSPIAVTNDIDNDLRNVTTPDIGADEFNGIGIDITPPTIIYTALGNTLSTSNRLLSSVDITDGSGVNTSSGTAPRIYYKKYSDANTFVDNTSLTNGWKYTESSSGSSPFDFTIDYSLLFGGSAQSGDTIQYFVVAQDLASTPNVGINQGTFASNPASVNLTSAAFPITGSINQYRIQYVISGVVTVGTGGNYPSLTGDKGLFVSIKENFVGGNVIAKVISDLTETGTHKLDQWTELVEANYTLSIQPDTSIMRTISGSYAGGLIQLNGSDRVTIDGRFNGTGKYLTFENTNAASNTAVIGLLSLGVGQGCSDITIRNCIIKAGSNASTNIFGIFGGSTGTLSTGNAGGADLDNLSFIENEISKCRTGIFIRGTSSDQMINLEISKNLVGSNTASDYVTEYGIYVGYADAPQVTENEIFNLHYDVSKWGIYFTSNVNNAVVSKNKVHSFSQPGTAGYNSVGIYFSSATGCFSNQIDNNMIYNLHTYGSTSMYLVGIRIAGGSDYKIYHNTVNLDGAFGNTSAGIVSSCLYISAAAANLDVRNNIFSNTRTGNNPKNYLIHSLNTTTFSNLDYNNYYNTGSVFGYWGSDISDFTNWKSTVGKDQNSNNVLVNFVSSTDVHLSGSSIGDGSLACASVGITSDIDGDTRNSYWPYMGADEVTASPLALKLTLKTLIEGYWGNGGLQDTIQVRLANPNSFAKSAPVLDMSSATGVDFYLPKGTSATHWIVVNHRNTIETWSASAVSFPSGEASYDFTDSETKAYGNNLKLVDGKWCMFSGDIPLPLQDGLIDLTDIVAVINDANTFVTGTSLATDLNGDNSADLSDIVIAVNNSNLFVTKQTPEPKIDVKSKPKKLSSSVE
mgnify:CR=1 FL=1